MAGRRLTSATRLVDQLAAVPVVREHRAEAADPAAELELALDQEDPEADVGEADRGPEAGDPAADHQRLRRASRRRAARAAS